jgi:hypothetical protein
MDLDLRRVKSAQDGKVPDPERARHPSFKHSVKAELNTLGNWGAIVSRGCWLRCQYSEQVLKTCEREDSTL